MYECASNMPAEQIEIPKLDFFLKFNVSDMKIKIQKYYKEFEKEANLLFYDYKGGISDLSLIPREESDEIIRIVIIQFKNDLDELLAAFQNKCGGEMQELDFYTLSIRLQKQHVKLCDQLVETVKELTSFSFFDKTDPRNLIKICPYCSLIWSKIKSEGCDGETICGQRTSNYFDVSTQPWYSFIITRVKGMKFSWTKNAKPLVKMENLKKIDKGVENKIGCGQKITWSKMQSISESQILDLFKVKTIDEAKKIIENEKFAEIQVKYEKEHIKADEYFK